MWDGGAVVDRLILDTTDFIRKVDESAKRLRDLTSQSQISLKLDKSFQQVTRKLDLLKTQLGELSTTKHLKIDAETSKVQQEVKRLYDSLMKVSAASKMAAADLSHLGNVNIKGPYDLVEKYYAAARRMKQRVPVPQAEEDLAVKYFKSLTPKEGAAIAEWVPGAFDKSTSAVKAFLATQEQANASVARAVSIVEPYVAGIRNAGNALERAAALNEGFKTSTAHIVKALEMMNAALESQRNAYIRTAEAAARYKASASGTATITTPQITPAGGMAQLPAIADWMAFLPSRKHIDAALDQSVIESRKAAEKYQQFVRTLVPKGGAAATGAIADWITFLPSNKHIEAALDQSVIASKKAYERYQQFMRTLIPAGKMAEQPAIADWITFLPGRTYIERALDQSVIASKKAAERYQQFVRNLIPVGRMAEQPAIADWITFLPSQRHIEQALDRSVIASRQAYVKYQAFLASLVPIAPSTVAAQTAVPFVNFQASTKHIQSFINTTKYARQTAADTATVIGASWDKNVSSKIVRSTSLLQRFVATARGAAGSQAGFVNMAGSIGTGFSLVGRAIDGIGRGIKNAARFTLGWYWSAAKIAVPFWAAYRTINLIELGIKTIAGELWNALAVAEKFKTQAISIGAIIASLTQAKDISGAFQAALRYAELLGPQLDLIAAKYMATGEEIQLVWFGFIREGLVPATKEAALALAETTDMIRMLTGEQQFAQQGLQEVAGLVKGIADQRSRLYMMVSKANPQFKDELRMMQAEAKITGDQTKIFQYIRDQIKGAGLASKYFANTWTGLKDTLRSILNIMERLAIAPIYGKLTGIFKQLRDELLTSKGELTEWAIDLTNKLSSMWKLMVYGIGAAIGLVKILFKQSGGVASVLKDIADMIFWSKQIIVWIHSTMSAIYDVITAMFHGMIADSNAFFGSLTRGMALVSSYIPKYGAAWAKSLNSWADYFDATAAAWNKSSADAAHDIAAQMKISSDAWAEGTKEYDEFIKLLSEPVTIQSLGDEVFKEIQALTKLFMPLKAGGGGEDAAKQHENALKSRYNALINLQRQYQQQLTVTRGLESYLTDESADHTAAAIALKEDLLQLNEKIRDAAEIPEKPLKITEDLLSGLEEKIRKLAVQAAIAAPAVNEMRKAFQMTEDWNRQAEVSEHLLKQWKLMPQMTREMANEIANVTFGFKKWNTEGNAQLIILKQLIESSIRYQTVQERIDFGEQTKQLEQQLIVERALNKAINEGIITKEKDANVLSELLEIFGKFTYITEDQVKNYVETTTALYQLKEANSKILTAQGESLEAWLDEISNERRGFVNLLKGLTQDLERYFSDVFYDILTGVELKFKDFFKNLRNIFARGIADLLASKMKEKFAEYLEGFLPSKASKQQKAGEYVEDVAMSSIEQRQLDANNLAQVLSSRGGAVNLDSLFAKPYQEDKDILGFGKQLEGVFESLSTESKAITAAANQQIAAADATMAAASANVQAAKIDIATSYEQVGILTRMKNWLSSTFGGGGGASSPAMAAGNVGGGGGGGGGLFSFLSGGSGKGFGGSLASLAQTILPLYVGGSIGGALGGMLSSRGLPGGTKVGIAAGLLSAMALGYAPAVGSLIGFGAGSAAAGAAGATGAFGAAGGTAMAGMSYLGPLGLAGSLGYLGGGYLSNAIWKSPGATKWGGIGGAAGGVGGALLGMKFGASLGSIVPGLGTIIGAVIGALIGALLGGFLGNNKDELERLYGKKSTLGMAKGIKELAGYSYKTEGEFPETVPGIKRFGLDLGVTRASREDWKAGGWREQYETFVDRAVTKINFLGKEFVFKYRHYSWAPGLSEKEMKRFEEWMKTMMERLKELVQEVGQALSQALTTSFEGADVQTGWKVFVETTHASFAKMISDALAGSFATSRLALEVTMPLREAIETAVLSATTAEGVFSPEMFSEMVAPAVEQYRGELENLLPVYEEIYNINKKLTDELTKKEEPAATTANTLNLTVSILGTGDQRQVAAELADTFLGELKRRGITVVNA